MIQNFKVVFYLRANYVRRDGKSSIRTRIYLNSERLELGATGQYIEGKYWNASGGRCKSRTAQALCVNSELDRIESDIIHIFRRMEFQETLSLEKIRNEYLGLDRPKHSFMEFYKQFVEDAKNEIGTVRSYASYQKFNVLLKHFTNFLLKKYNRKDIMLAELNYGYISAFESYLKTEAGQSHNTTMRQMRNFKTVIIKACKLGLLEHDPFVDFKFKFKQVDRGFLTDDEIKRLIQKDFSIQRLEQVRDIFVFSCFTGLAYIDVKHLTSEHIIELDSKQWIMIRRQKTDVPTTVLLLQVPKMILAKYKGVDPKGHLLPVLSNQKMNAYLKEIADLCGITKNLTFHIARHTFATMALSKGVPVESISRMLGHTNIRTTQIYAKITNKKIEADMLDLSSKLTDLETVAFEQSSLNPSADKNKAPNNTNDEVTSAKTKTSSPRKTKKSIANSHSCG